MAALIDGISTATGGYMSVKATGEYAGVSKQAVFGAIAHRRLHPVHIPGLSYRVFHRGEVLAWHHRLVWRPTPEDMATLLAEGYRAEDFTPATPDELAAPSGAVGALVSQADVRAYLETLMREGQTLTASVAPVVGSATESAMRGWLETTGASVSPPEIADVAARITESAIRPIVETIRANVTPLTESLAQAALPRPTPPPEDAVARQMGALRVELAQLLTRLMNAMRPIVERLASGGYITPEDVAPFMALVGDLAAGLAGTPFYDLTPRDAPAQMPALLAQISADTTPTTTASHSPTPTPHDPGAGKD